MARIEGAPDYSPINIYTCLVPGHVNACFANTVAGEAHIRAPHPRLIGTFWGLNRSDEYLAGVKALLQTHLGILEQAA